MIKNRLMIIVLLLLETARKSKQVLFGEIPKSINIMFGFISRYLEALVEIYTANEYITNHPSLKERARLIEVQNNVIKRLVEECTTVLAQLLKGERVCIPKLESRIDCICSLCNQ